MVEVNPAGPSAGIIRAGDVIEEINRVPIRSLDDYKQTAGKIRSGEGVLLRVRREGRSLFLAIEAK